MSAQADWKSALKLVQRKLLPPCVCRYLECNSNNLKCRMMKWVFYLAATGLQWSLWWWPYRVALQKIQNEGSNLLLLQLVFMVSTLHDSNDVVRDSLGKLMGIFYRDKFISRAMNRQHPASLWDGDWCTVHICWQPLLYILFHNSKLQISSIISNIQESLIFQLLQPLLPTQSPSNSCHRNRKQSSPKLKPLNGFSNCRIHFPITIAEFHSRIMEFLSLQSMDAETCSLRCILEQCFQDTNEALLKKLQAWFRV